MSTLEVSNLNDGTTTVATTYVTNGSAKAWATTQQTSTMALRDSFNVSSVADGGTASSDYTFTNAFSSANFSAVLGQSNDNNFTGIETGHTASTMTLLTNQHDGTGEDAAYQNFQACGDLA